MYKLMIVEDEPIERKALHMMIVNSGCAVELVPDAENGFAAIALHREHAPDIILMDINMPGINGLDTIREIQKRDDKVRFLILSSYNRFEYAQEAIKLGVEDFIVKPAKSGDLKAAIDAVVKKIDDAQTVRHKSSALSDRIEAIRPIVESDCILALISSNSREEIDRLVSFLGYRVREGFCFIVTCKGNHGRILGEIKASLAKVAAPCLGDQVHDMLVFFVYGERALDPSQAREIGAYVDMVLKNAGWHDCLIGVGNPVDKVEAFCESYSQAVKALLRAKNGEPSPVYYVNLKPQGAASAVDVSDYAQKLAAAIVTTERKTFRQLLDKASLELFMSGCELQAIKNTVYQLLLLTHRTIASMLPAVDLNGQQVTIESMLGVVDLRSAEKMLLEQMEHLYSIVSQLNLKTYNAILAQALDFIDAQFNRRIALEDLAEQLRISPFYLSKLLNKHTGRSFSELVSQKRVAHARELLKGQMSIKEITYECGFGSQNYFTKVFRKYVGMTPSEFRNNYAARS